MEGKRIPPDDGEVDERISQQLEGEDGRADGDDEEPKLGHHPAVEHSPPNLQCYVVHPKDLCCNHTGYPDRRDPHDCQHHPHDNLSNQLLRKHPIQNIYLINGTKNADKLFARIAQGA